MVYFCLKCGKEEQWERDIAISVEREGERNLVQEFDDDQKIGKVLLFEASILLV
jgi:DNA-directed RNA polymerase subunit RPC12/RpoP